MPAPAAEDVQCLDSLHANLFQVLQSHLVNHAPGAHSSGEVVPAMVPFRFRAVAHDQHTADTRVAALVEPPRHTCAKGITATAANTRGLGPLGPRSRIRECAMLILLGARRSAAWLGTEGPVAATHSQSMHWLHPVLAQHSRNASIHHPLVHCAGTTSSFRFARPDSFASVSSRVAMWLWEVVSILATINVMPSRLSPTHAQHCRSFAAP